MNYIKLDQDAESRGDQRTMATQRGRLRFPNPIKALLAIAIIFAGYYDITTAIPHFSLRSTDTMIYISDSATYHLAVGV